jgi:hypothetical protein
MSARKPLDRIPGSAPEIRADGDNVTFRLDVAGISEQAKLVLRCDADGGVWATIVLEPTAPRHAH